MTLVAAIQINSSDDVNHNLAMVAEYIERAHASGAELVVLPECFALMPKQPSQLLQHAEVHGAGAIQNFLAQLAQRLKIWIIAGTVPLCSDTPQRIYNALLVYDECGENVARYDKIHLFDAALAGGEQYCESSYTMAGNACVVQTTPIGIVGLTVCYDLRFPELYRKLSGLGATCLVVPSAFAATTGKAHWLPLLRARAIENTCYVIAPAQVGKHANGRCTYGNSMIIDPWGEIIAERKTAPGVILATLEPDKLAQIRAQLPCLSHRRPELFA